MDIDISISKMREGIEKIINADEEQANEMLDGVIDLFDYIVPQKLAKIGTAWALDNKEYRLFQLAATSQRVKSVVDRAIVFTAGKSIVVSPLESPGFNGSGIAEAIAKNQEAVSKGLGEKRILAVCINDEARTTANACALISILSAYVYAIQESDITDIDDVRPLAEKDLDFLFEMYQECASDSGSPVPGSFVRLAREFCIMDTTKLEDNTLRAVSPSIKEPLLVNVRGPGSDSYGPAINLEAFRSDASFASIVTFRAHDASKVLKIYKDTVTGATLGFDVDGQKTYVLSSGFDENKLPNLLDSFFFRFDKSKSFDQIHKHDMEVYKECEAGLRSEVASLSRYMMSTTLRKREKQLLEAQKCLEKHMQELASAKMNINRLNHEIFALSRAPVNTEYIESRINMLKSHDKVKLVMTNRPSADSLNVAVFTNNLHAEAGGDWYDIGTFCIVIKFKKMGEDRPEYDLKMYNTKHTCTGFWGEGCHAPHVDGHGSPCEGDLTGSIGQALGSFDIASVVTMCISFLQTANLKDAAGKLIKNWPKVPEEEVFIKNNMGADQKIAGAEALTEQIASLRDVFARRNS